MADFNLPVETATLNFRPNATHEEVACPIEVPRAIQKASTLMEDEEFSGGERFSPIRALEVENLMSSPTKEDLIFDTK